MKPILFQFAGISVYSYGLMVAVGFLAAMYLLQKEARRQGIDPNKIMDLGLLVLISGIVGGRLLYVLLNIDKYIKNPIEAFFLFRGGLVFYGGLLAGLLAGWVFLRRNKMPFLKTADLIILYAVLAHAFGRIGCFLNGCCYGKPTASFLGIRPPGEFVTRYPTQLYSALALLVLFFILRIAYTRPRRDGSILLWYFLVYPLFRFLLEFLRGDSRPEFLFMTFSQVVSLAIFLAAALVLLRKVIKR